jgi:hypothetical protein
MHFRLVRLYSVWSLVFSTAFLLPSNTLALFLLSSLLLILHVSPAFFFSFLPSSRLFPAHNVPAPLDAGTESGIIHLPAAERVTALTHPDTYLNKVIAAYASGSMDLWGLRTHTRIYRFNRRCASAPSSTESARALRLFGGLI